MKPGHREMIPPVDGGEFGAFLRRTRLRRHLSIESLVARAGGPQRGVHKAQISRTENGKLRPTLGIILAYTRALELRAGDLVDHYVTILAGRVEKPRRQRKGRRPDDDANGKTDARPAAAETHA